jgi:hypothetical protein
LKLKNILHDISEAPKPYRNIDLANVVIEFFRSAVGLSLSNMKTILIIFADQCDEAANKNPRMPDVTTGLDDAGRKAAWKKLANQLKQIAREIY